MIHRRETTIESRGPPSPSLMVSSAQHTNAAPSSVSRLGHSRRDRGDHPPHSRPLDFLIYKCFPLTRYSIFTSDHLDIATFPHRNIQDVYEATFIYRELESWYDMLGSICSCKPWSHERHSKSIRSTTRSPPRAARPTCTIQVRPLHKAENHNSYQEKVS